MCSTVSVDTLLERWVNPWRCHAKTWLQLTIKQTDSEKGKRILLVCDGALSDRKWQHPPGNMWHDLWIERKVDEATQLWQRARTFTVRGRTDTHLDQIHFLREKNFQRPVGIVGWTSVQCAPSMQYYWSLINFYFTKYTFSYFSMVPNQASVTCLSVRIFFLFHPSLTLWTMCVLIQSNVEKCARIIEVS